MNIYLVGPLFSEAESKQRIYEEKVISQFLEENKVDFTLFNPITMPLNSDASTNATKIALEDYQRLSLTDVCFFDLANEDSGSCVALGMMIEKFKNGKDIQFYPVISDIRLARPAQSGYESCYGFNSMVIGTLKSNHIEIFPTFEEAFQSFKQTIIKDK
ncbi:MAG: nucleoside 2-deoxyribosyltransferase [Erysipelotrichaceae bacterium]